MDFVIIDLKSQAAAIASYAQSWSNQRFLDWLAQFGQVFPVKGYEGSYTFQATSGPLNGFSLSDDGQFTVFDIPVEGGITHFKIRL